MNLNVRLLAFLLDLLENYRRDIFIKMRKDGHPIEQILAFIDGYTGIYSTCHIAIKDPEYNGECLFLDTIVFEDYNDIMNTYDIIINKVREDKHRYIGWEMLGAKYALCLIKFYIEFVLYGNDTEVCDFYLTIPDKNNPNSYHWDECGWDYDFFNDDI